GEHNHEERGTRKVCHLSPIYNSVTALSRCRRNKVFRATTSTTFFNDIESHGFIAICCLSGANNLVPIEIALKIATKIKMNKRFSAYIVLPMWREGKPTGLIAQRSLYSQYSSHDGSTARVLAVVSLPWQ
ncbi:hypothetical protein ZWY2020_055948, partial [Hordeum vulgare]